jgi:hypothetical protein
MSRLTIRERVTASIFELKGMTHTQLKAWATANEMEHKTAFARFKKALAANGINYDRLIAVASADKTAHLEANATASLTLYSDAMAKNDRFAICDKRGNPVWHGRFFATDHDYNGEQSSGEIAVAKKAVWLASKVKETLGLSAIKLALKVDAEWLCYANAVRQGKEGGGRARALGDLAVRSGVVLTVEHVAGGKNPADKYTISAGFKKWQDTDLTTLID